MVERNETANLLFFVIGISFCFVLPCFATGCHTFPFQIAAAALRPRNDTKIGTVLFEKGRFSFLRLFFAVDFLRGIAPLKFKTFRSENRFVSQQNLSILSLRGGRVRPTWQSLTKRFVIP